MTDQELIQELVKKQIISETDATKVLREAELAEASAEEILYSKRLTDEVSVAKIKSTLTGAPYKKIDATAIPAELLKLIPKDVSENYRVVPIEKKDNTLIVGMLRPDNERAQEALRFIAKRERVSLGVYIVTPSDLALVWRRYQPYKDEIASAIKELDVETDDRNIVLLDEGMHSAEDAPIIKIVASTLQHAVEMLASDIHIEPQRTYLRVRFRVDGELREVASIPSVLSQPVISRIKVLAKLRLDETRVPQDGRFRTMIAAREIDFRVATFPTPSGEKVALRVLDSSTGLKGLKEIGLSDYNFKFVDAAANAPFGMILISGPTGSGKSTTLYAVMQRLNTDEVNIVSLEDPVEYYMNGINQSQVRPEIGYTFASGLRQILRQDPDVIMVGEIRDEETASLSVNAALTGHVMLSTIHTNNAVGVIPRLVDLKVPPFLLASSLNLMLAQRLVGQLCPDCKKQEEAGPDLQKIIRSEIEELPEEIKIGVKKKFGENKYSVYHPSSGGKCPTCKGKGTKGRIAIFEVFRMTRELGDLIMSQFTEGKLWDEAHRQGMITLRQDGILKALEGKVLIEEVLRETE